MSLPIQNFYIVLKIRNKSNINTSVRDLVLTKDNLQYLNISENVLSILPKFEMVINDVGGLTETFPILDNDVLSITISESEESESMLEMDFIISDYAIDSDNGENYYSVIKLVGYMKCTDMFIPYRNRSFDNVSSIDILNRIATESRIVFKNPQNIRSNDNMIWYQDENNYDFIKHILERGYIGDDTIFGYCNTKNEFVCTSLVSEMTKVTKFNAIMNPERVYNYLLSDTERGMMFFNSYDIVCLHGVYNKMSNYGAAYGFYNMQAELESGILDNVRKFTDLYNKSRNYDGRPAIFINNGLFGNPNIYKEFPIGMIQNCFMKYNFFENSIVLNINSMTDVKLFDKINLSIPSVLNEELNDVHSGFYLVTGITHNVSINGVYQKKVMVCRNGINKSEELREYNVN